MKKPFALILASFTSFTFAHSGHGTTEGVSLFHWAMDHALLPAGLVLVALSGLMVRHLRKPVRQRSSANRR